MRHYAKSGIKRILISIILASVLLFTSFSSAIAVPFNYGSFTIVLLEDSASSDFASRIKAIDLSGIKIDVYNAVLHGIDPTTGSSTYVHGFASSVVTKSDGSVTFKKPSELFLVIIDLETLPKGVGVEKDTIFCGDISQSSHSICLSVIDDVVISYDDTVTGGVRVDILNAKNERVFAPYSVTMDTISNARSAIFDDTYRVSGSVVIYGVVEFFEFTLSNNTNPIERVANALKENQVTKEEALDFFLEIYDARTFGKHGTFLATQLVALYEDVEFRSQLPMDKQDELTSVVSPSPSRGIPYYRGPSGTGYFSISYDDPFCSGLVYSAPPVIQQIYDALNDTLALFVTQLGYNQPYSSGSHYEVYIDTSTWLNEYSAITFVGSAGASRFEVYGLIDLYYIGTADLNYLKSVLTHEYFHAIQNSYKWLHYLDNWFKESFASWASRRQYGTVGNGNKEINDFLSSPDTALTGQQPYGTALFPLYIYLHHSGTSQSAKDASMRAIIENTATRDCYNAIDYVMKNINSPSQSFEDVFAKFWVNNYVPHTTYVGYVYASPTMTSKPGYINYSSPSASPAVNPLACQFVDFGTGFSSMTISNVTLGSPSGKASNLRFYWIMKNSGGGYVIPTNSSATGVTGALWTISIPSGYAGGSLAIVNTDKPGWISCKIVLS